MIDALIIDDQETNSILLKEMVMNFFPNFIRPHTSSNAIHAIELVESIQPDLIFLDINMPEVNGFDLLKQIREIHVAEVIFVTAYTEFALNAYESQAVGYLTKPVATEKFVQTVTRTIEFINQKKNSVFVETFTQAFKQHNHDKKITLKSQKGLTFVDPATILYCESRGNYTTFFLTNKEQIVVSKQIGSFENKIDIYSIIRVHDRYLVNLQHVKNYVRANGGHLILTNGKEIPVSVKRKDKFLKYFED